MQFPIQGLEYEEIPFMQNGGESFVLPLPTTRPVHIVFHGDLPFNHGHYGLHKGLADGLIFLGHKEKRITGYFVDCRKGSATFGIRHEVKLSPSAKHILKIPTGVGHAFEGLDGVFTINAYEAYLPPPEYLLTSKNPWSTGADILNFSFQTELKNLPEVEVNLHPASDRFYDVLRDYQKATLGTVIHDYPVTEVVAFEDGTTASLSVRKPIDRSLWPAEWEQISNIDGLGWRRHYIVMGDDATGYSALLDPAPIQVIDHGSEKYSHDAYGIHLESEDRLTFLGATKSLIKGNFIDCREGSETFRREVEICFSPSALKYLVVPPGVAHAFEGLENVFTINRPRRCAGDLEKMEPGNDIIDWPLHSRPAPSFFVEQNEAPLEYYKSLVMRQKRYLKEGSLTSSAFTVLVEDAHGSPVRVLLRKE